MAAKQHAEIPAEIIHRIINELQDDVHALQKTSLVTRSFLHPSQQTLFSKISVNLHNSVSASVETRRLVSTLNTKPELALHVRELTLTISGMQSQAPELTSIVRRERAEVLSTLAMFQHLRKLALRYLEPYMGHFNPDLQRAILNLCALPDLTTLALTDTRGFPIDYIIPQLPRLKELFLTNVDLTREKSEELSLGLSGGDVKFTETAFPGQLEVLCFDCITARNSLVKLFRALVDPQSRLDVTNMRALKISGHGPYFEETKAIEKVMGFVAEKLECFVWGTLDEASVLRIYSSLVSYQPRFDTGAINLATMINLRCLAVSFVLNIGYGSYTANTAWIMNSLNDMKANNRLEEIIFVLYPNQIADTAPDMEEWTSRLDLLPLRDGFRNISRVSVYLATQQWHQFPVGTEHSIMERMPSLHASGALTVERLRDWHEAHSVYDDAIARTLRTSH